MGHNEFDGPSNTSKSVKFTVSAKKSKIMKFVKTEQNKSVYYEEGKNDKSAGNMMNDNKAVVLNSELPVNTAVNDLVEIKKKAKKPEKYNPHKDHRKRMRERFRAEGLSSMADHNIFELLLFYAIPMKDTNPIAHSLIERFGSISGVFDATEEELLEIPGITENGAILIKLIPELASVYMKSKFENKIELSDIDSIGRYLVGYFMNKTNEHVVLLFFNDNKLIHTCELSSGTPDMSDVSFRRIAEIAFSKKATSFVIAHNHPSGDCTPSKEDISLTQRMLTSFESMELYLREHIIVSGEKYCGIIELMRK